MTEPSRRSHPSPRRRRRQGRPLDVAVIGLACRFPGASDATTFFENVLAGKDSTGDVPASRWDPALFYDPEATENDRVTCRRGGYLDEPLGFDPAAHGIMPIVVDGGEPEQFLVLDTARAALADAGLTEGLKPGARVEVVIGRGNYFNRGNLTRLQHGRIVAQTVAILAEFHPEWSEADREAVRADLKASLPPFEAGTVPGQLTNATASRVSERLDLSGASYVVDAASASSLVALDLGARALVERRADLALVGGVYLQPDVDFPMVFSRLGALSRGGRARPFARDADGTIPGEGVGVVVLKRRADAERDGDRIYAVVKGVGLSSDGRGAGLAAPSAKGHARAIRRAYRASGVDPASVGYVEGHGLGVPASDRAELRALLGSFPPTPHARRALGSLTALIGHAMPAAGIAALIKTALALHHRVIPPSPHADRPHDLLVVGRDRLALAREARPWVHGDDRNPRRAGVNAFGFAGVNAHAVLEEHSPTADGVAPGCLTTWDTEAFLLGADDRAGWVELAGALLDWLESGVNATVSLKDLAATLNVGQQPFPFRVGLVASSTADLCNKLRAAIARVGDAGCRAVRDAQGTYFWGEPLGGPGRLAFLYPGEGSQYPRMLADLCPHFPEVRRRLDVADRIAVERGLQRLPSDELFDPDDANHSTLFGVGTAVNVVLSTQWALHQLLVHLGLRPDSVAGHSSGEFIALAAADALRVDRTFEDRLGDLGTVFERLERDGLVPTAALVAVAAPRERVEAACRDASGSVRVAIDNCPHQVVIAGEDREVAAVVARLRAGGVICEELPFRRAYHTPQFAAAIGPVRDFFGGLALRPPGARLYSCATAAATGTDVETVRRLAVEQWVAPVDFRRTVEAMHADGVRLFVEVGARGSLTGYVEDTLRGRPHFAVAANLPRRSGLTQLNHLVASLYAHGVDPRAEYLYARRRPRRIDLSTDIPPPRPLPPLAVGFPEMRLSDGLVERSRGKRSAPPIVSNGSRLDRYHPEPSRPSNGSAGYGNNGHAAPNGVTHRSEATRTNGESAQAVAEATPPVASLPGSTTPSADAAMLTFFETMNAFLDTQQSVLRAYLDSGSVGAADAPVARVPAAVAAPVVVTPAERFEVAATPDDEAVEVNAADAGSLLVELVAPRTGYPREMLGLDLDMEADLGIDSIKRVEILGELQERGYVPESVDPERLSRCRTLGQVVSTLGRGASAAARPGASPVGWVGTVEEFRPGRRFVGVRPLDAADDPVAANHTLGGRRISRAEPGLLGLPVIPYTVMAELLAQAAVTLMPDKAVVGFRDLQANRWIGYADGTTAVEIRAERDPSRPDEVRASIRTRGTARGNKAGDDPAVEGIVVFADRREPGPLLPEFALPEAGPCRFAADMIYRDQWLFHGPALQAVQSIGAASRHGIEGTLRVMPRRALLPESHWPVLHTDPIVLDAFTHLLGCWGLDKQAGEEGDVMFPLRLASMTLHGDDPPEGALVDCRIRVLDVTRHRVKVDADLVAPDGRLWVALRGWEDWRFYWPGRYRDVFRMPESVFVGEPLFEDAETGAVGVWLEPPADMAKPVWRDVLEWVQLGPDERRANRDEGGSDHEFTLRLWERVAAKESARRLLLARGEPATYPADLEFVTDSDGRAALRSRLEPTRDVWPRVATASTEGVALAVGWEGPTRRVGLAVARAEADTWNDRVACATQAARRSGDVGSELEFAGGDEATGEVLLRGAGVAWRCRTGRRGDYVWAWARSEDGS